MQEKKSQMVKNILGAVIEHANVKGIRELANLIGETPSKLYGWIRNGRITDTGSLLTKFPYLSITWLKTGQGPMMIIDKDNINLRPESQYQDKTEGLVSPKIAARIEPGNELQRQRIAKKKAANKAVGKTAADNTDFADDNQMSISDMLWMTGKVLESKTVYRSALASNVRAFYQAVQKEDEMKSVLERLEAMQAENRELANQSRARDERMERMEEMLLSLGAVVPQKREQGNG